MLPLTLFRQEIIQPWTIGHQNWSSLGPSHPLALHFSMLSESSAHEKGWKWVESTISHATGGRLEVVTCMTLSAKKKSKSYLLDVALFDIVSWKGAWNLQMVIPNHHRSSAMSWSAKSDICEKNKKNIAPQPRESWWKNGDFISSIGIEWRDEKFDKPKDISGI